MCRRIVDDKRNDTYLFEDALGAAIPHVIENFQVFCKRCNHLAIAAGNRRQHHIDLFLLNQPAIFGEHGLCAGALIYEEQLHRHAANTAFPIPFLDDQLG